MMVLLRRRSRRLWGSRRRGGEKNKGGQVEGAFPGISNEAAAIDSIGVESSTKTSADVTPGEETLNESPGVDPSGFAPTLSVGYSPFRLKRYFGPSEEDEISERSETSDTSASSEEVAKTEKPITPEPGGASDMLQSTSETPQFTTSNECQGSNLHPCSSFESIKLNGHQPPDKATTVQASASLSNGSKLLKPPSIPRTLSEMIHPFDPSLFRGEPSSSHEFDGELSQDEEIKDSSVCVSESQAGRACGDTSMITSDHSAFDSSTSQTQASRQGTVRTDLCASLLTASPDLLQEREDPHRVCYELESGRQGMSHTQKQHSRDLLAGPPLVVYCYHGSDDQWSECSPISDSCDSGPRQDRVEIDCFDSFLPRAKVSASLPTSLYVFLIQPELQLFEVVPINCTRAGLTIGEVLSACRKKASDPALANQAYSSLCNLYQELAAPMLPLYHLFAASSSRQQSLCLTSDVDCSFNTQYGSEWELLEKSAFPKWVATAVPRGSNATVCREITLHLMRNPRMQRWLARPDPFQKRSGNRSKSDHPTKTPDQSRKGPEAPIGRGQERAKQRITV